MKCSLGIFNFLEEISSLCHSIVFLYFFTLITEEGFLISSCYSLELCIQMLISFLFSFAFHVSSFQTDLNNYDGVITHLETDILECKVKRALGSITMNKANGGLEHMCHFPPCPGSIIRTKV